MLKIFKKTKYILTWHFPFIVKRPVKTLSIVEKLAKVKSTFVDAYNEAKVVDNEISEEVKFNLALIQRTTEANATLDQYQKDNGKFMSQLSKFI